MKNTGDQETKWRKLIDDATDVEGIKVAVVAALRDAYCRGLLRAAEEARDHARYGSIDRNSGRAPGAIFLAERFEYLAARETGEDTVRE